MMAGRNCIFSVPFFLWWAQMAKKPRLRAEMHRLKDDDKFNTIHHMSAKEWVMFLLRPGTRTRNFPYVPPLPDDFFLCFFLRFAFYASRVSETKKIVRIGIGSNTIKWRHLSLISYGILN
eukprot:GEMP01063791.1.p1 GENE.GEMP01063791.1~~GEMP01063791.1.p1  ORF type:complete len:120 (+),score=14.33 GEMP01063791.1:562-921(+)